MSELKYSKTTKFLINNKILRYIPLYVYFRGYLIGRYARKMMEDIIELGNYSINHGNIVTASDNYKLKVGKFSSIGGGVSIILSSAHRSDWISTYPFIQLEDTNMLNHIQDNKKKGRLSAKGDIEIGNDVWIGQNAIILPGVKIGDGAVIGAGSVVTKNVDDYEIVAGNPAKRIKCRFKDTQIIELKKIKWWDWPINKIKNNRALLESSDINEFIEKFKKG